MSCSVVIVTYQTGPALWLAVDSALAQENASEVIIVDNGNPADVVKRLTQKMANEPRLQLVTGHGNIGFAAACNRGAQTATQDYILFLNPDCRLPQGALVRMQQVQTSTGAKLIGCFLANPDGSEQRGSRRNLLTPKTALQELFGMRGVNRPSESLPDAPVEVPAISGACMFMRRQAYLDMGGMDEGYFLHMEDMDLCLRIQRAGGKTIWIPDVKVLHLRSTSAVSAIKTERCKKKGFIRYFRQHFSGPFLPVWIAGITLRFFIRAAIAACIEFVQQPQHKKRGDNRLLYLYRQVKPESSDWLKDKTVLVTGASSQVGICTIAELLNIGAHVVALTHRTSIFYTHPRLQWLQGDMQDKDFTLGGVKPDILVHAAGLWLLSGALPKILGAGVKRVLAFSSMSVVTKQHSNNKQERKIAEGLLSAETAITDLCKKSDILPTIFRPTMIYGVGFDRNVMRLAAAIRRLRWFPLYGEGSGLRQPVQANDLATAVVQCIPNPMTCGKTYELGGATRLSYRELLTRIFEVLGIPPRFFSIVGLPLMLTMLGKAYQISHVHGEMALRMNRDMVCDNDPAERDFNYTPHAFEITSDMI